MTTTSAVELVLVLAHELVEVLAADFLLALDEDLDVDRQRPGLLQPGLDGLEVHEDLALVVGRAARVDLAVAHRRLKRRRLPQVHRVDRLHVVVPVEQHRRRAGGAEPVGVDDRVARRLDQPTFCIPMRSQLVGGPLGAPAHVGLMLRQRADAGNGEVALQLLDVAVAMKVDEVDDVVGHNRLRAIGLRPSGSDLSNPAHLRNFVICNLQSAIVNLRLPWRSMGSSVLIPPFLPRAEVVAHARVAEQAQREIGVRGAVAALAVRHDFPIGRHAGLLEHRLQVRGRLERAVGAEALLSIPGARHLESRRRAPRARWCRSTRRRIACRGSSSSASPRRSCTSFHVASSSVAPRRRSTSSASARRARATAAGRRPSRRRTPPSSTRTSGWPKNSRNQNARAARVPDVSS